MSGMVERYPGHFDDLPECPTCEIKMFEESDGTPENDDWHECPKCGEIAED